MKVILVGSGSGLYYSASRLKIQKSGGVNKKNLEVQ
jgi:hypothetical protein